MSRWGGEKRGFPSFVRGTVVAVFLCTVLMVAFVTSPPLAGDRWPAAEAGGGGTPEAAEISSLTHPLAPSPHPHPGPLPEGEGGQRKRSIGGRGNDQALSPGWEEDLAFFSSIKDRTTGSADCEKAADYILDVFEKAGLRNVSVQKFQTPVPEVVSASLAAAGENVDIYPWGPNLVTLPTTPPHGISGPMVYGGNGDFSALDGRSVKGSVVLMEMASLGNWMNAALLDAAAVIFLGSPDSVGGEFQVKNIPTPVAFPRFWVTPQTAERLRSLAQGGPVEAKVISRTRWQNKTVRNLYGFIEGKDPKLRGELVVIDAFYDASSYVLGLAPGADEATSIVMLLSLARELAHNPPDRSVLLLATTGNGQGLAGMRHFIWSITTRQKILRKDNKNLQAQKKQIDRQMDLIRESEPFAVQDPEERDLVRQVVVEEAKDRTDTFTREIQYRQLTSPGAGVGDLEDPRPYRRLSWITSLDELTVEQRPMALRLAKEAMPRLRTRRTEIQRRREVNQSAVALRNLLDEYTPVSFISLYLSSHSSFMGLVELGSTYPVRENVKRLVRASRLLNILSQTGAVVASETGLSGIMRTPSAGMGADDGSSRTPSFTHPCCDVGVLAGLPAVSLMTVDDYRTRWSTPHDTAERVNRDNLSALARFLPPLLHRLVSHPGLAGAAEAGISGLASLEGRAMFIRQGELFPDQPAPGTIISVLQGQSVFRTMVYQDGTFFMPGLANRRVSLEKLIVEPYGLDPETGRVAWTADKAQTGKNNYRIKVKSDLASTSLIMFHCEQTDVLGAFNPRNLSYLTKVQLLDALTEANPLRYWYSRVDGRDTMAISLFLEKGTRFKLILSESLLSKDLFLLNAGSANTEGSGFLVGSPPTLALAPQQVVKDLTLLLGGRLRNLSQHGIINRHLEALYESSSQELRSSEENLAGERFDAFWENVIASWAKLNVIYSEIESTQRDVLGGVMFFIALFVPFAYCMERYLFAFRHIYQQITAFFVILLMTIFTIRALHPAFQLTYNPMVVILAFFIVGLSVLVSWIIFMRFEEEMALSHSPTGRASLGMPQVSKWQAFGAGFAIGVSNLNRRKLRTALTCATLVILTFTVMSFTNVKSLHTTTSTRIAEEAPYRGVMVRHQYLLPLTLQTLQYLKTQYADEAAIWPKAWIDPMAGADRTIARITAGARHVPVEGVLGLGEAAPPFVRAMVTHGRWFNPGERQAVLLPVALAQRLNLDPVRDLDVPVQLMGDTFTVVGYFDSNALESAKDLDQAPLAPAYMEFIQSEELSEAEIEAMQSGEEILPQTERFRYAGAYATVILPFETCLNYGGSLKAVNIVTPEGMSPLQLADRVTSWLAFPVYVGEDGVWYSSASSTVRYQGVANLLVPILIVIFITLNTMIGHVHERQREISTYTSVGLAPTHVGFLFIVEAMSLAVISTVIGYILAQLSARYLGHTILFSQLTFNYSSLASVACMFLVFSVVFLAALYPARMAAEMAMPDVNRTWTLPEPDGDTIFMNLPFLLKHDEERGIMGFLRIFYDSHRDVTHGAFTVDEVALDEDSPPVRLGEVPAPVCLLIRTNVWLAPFDFGIKQRIHLHCCPSTDNPGYLEIAINMIRLSGERSAWVRANKNFVKALRKQMLLWRLMDQEKKAEFGTV